MFETSNKYIYHSQKGLNMKFQRSVNLNKLKLKVHTR